MKSRAYSGIRFALAMACASLTAQASYAQQNEAPAEVVEGPPEVQAELQAQPTALPDEDVMKPTKNVVHFTPKMARGMAMHMAKEMARPDLPEDQRQELQERLARRIMNVGHQHGKDLVPFFQTLMAQMFRDQRGRIPATAGQEVGRLGEKAAPAIRTFADGLAEDVRPYVSPEEYQKALEEEEKMKQAADHVQEEMAKWARGELPEGDRLENPFEILEDAVEDKGESPAESEENKSDVRKQLDRQSEWSYWQKTPQGWRWFLQRIRRTFDFTDEQYEKGMAILRDYEKRANEIMTPEWKKRIQRNRLLFQCQYHLQEKKTQEMKTDDGQTFQMPVQAQNIQPWLFQINVEFADMTAPLDEMKKQFTRQVLNLATPEQRQAVIAQVRTLASAHGMEEATVQAAIELLSPPPDDRNAAGDEAAGSQPEGQGGQPTGGAPGDTSADQVPAP